MNKAGAVNKKPYSQAIALGFVVLILASWYALSLVYPPYLVPKPASVTHYMIEFVSNWGYARHSLATLGHIVAAIGLSFILGTVLVMVAHFFPVWEVAIHHRLSPFANSFSSVGWTILAVVWLGVGLATVLVAMTAILLPFVLINLRAGFKALSEEHLEMAQSFTRNPWRHIRLIIFPSITPYIFASLRITFGMACQVVLIAELFGGNSGLGYLVNIASQEVDTPLIFAVALIMVILFQVADRLVFNPLQTKLSQTYGYA